LLKKGSGVDFRDCGGDGEAKRWIRMDRSSAGIKAIASTPTGLKLIHAKQVLITSPPKTDLLKFFDLSDKERRLFSQFNNSAYYTGLLRNTGIPDNTTLLNARPDTEYFLPGLPGLYRLYPTGLPGLINVKFGSPVVLSDNTVKEHIISAIRRLGEQGTFPGAGTKKIEFVEFQGHNPFELTVSTHAIRKGFYKDLYALQGQRSTWYTGAAFHTHDSTLLWGGRCRGGLILHWSVTAATRQ
jgi:hypothetical protein